MVQSDERGPGRNPEMRAPGAETAVASRSWTNAEPSALMEAVLERGNLMRAYQRVVRNKGAAAIPVNLADSVPLRAEFDQKALGRSSSQVKAYWSKLVFTGKGTPPKEVASDSEVLELVASNPNLIGYVSAGAVSAKVKVLLTLE